MAESQDRPVGAPEGNQNAVKKRRVVFDTLTKVAVQNPDKLRKACEILLDKAEEGDIQAFKEIRDTLDGKPAQTIIGDDENPLSIQLIRRIIVRE